MSLISRLNTLSNALDTGEIFHYNRSLDKILEVEADTAIETISKEFSDVQDAEKQEQWLIDFFNGFFQFFHKPTTVSKIDIKIVVKLIETLLNIFMDDSDDNGRNDIFFKIFVATSLNYGKSNDKIFIQLCIELAQNFDTVGLNIFKFSSVGIKLMTPRQTSYYKHILKKARYQIKKYNLLAESVVGYSELSTLLFSAYNSNHNLANVEYYSYQLTYIMGKYCLDPMRCLDVIFQISSKFIKQNYYFLIKLLKKTDFWPIELSNNNDINSLNGGGNNMASKVLSNHIIENPSDIDYFDMICILFKAGFISFLSIDSNIGPDDETLQNFSKQYNEELEKESLKGVENPLAMAAALSDDSDDEHEKSKEKTDDKASNSTKEEEVDDFTILKEKILNSPKLTLLERMLAHGCIIPSIHLLTNHRCLIYIKDSLPIFFGRLFEKIIDPIYENNVLSNDQIKNLNSVSKYNTSNSELLSKKSRLTRNILTSDPLKPFSHSFKYIFYYKEWIEWLPEITEENFFKIIYEFLSVFGPSLGKNPEAITKLCRIGRNAILNASESNKTEIMDKWIGIVRKFIFPSIPLLESNPMITSEIFALMKLFPFEKRYYIYNELIIRTSKDNLLVLVDFNKAEKEAKSILKSLSTETVEKDARKLAYLISTNPMATLSPTVNQIENYDKVSELVIYTTQYFNDFAYDVLQYVLLLHFTQERKSMQADGINQSPWVLRLSLFVAGLAKSCPTMDLTNIIIYIKKTLNKGNVVATTLLRELIVTVSGIRDLQEVNVKSLQLLNSGEPLQKVARHLIFDKRDDNFAIAQKLVYMFVEQNAISEIIILLYKLNLEANTYDSHYKILSAQSDQMNTLLWSFIELIHYCLSPEEFKENVFSFKTLTNDYGLPQTWAFHIWRKYIKEDLDFENILDNENFQQTEFHDIDFTYLSKDLFDTFWVQVLFDIQFNKKLYEETKAKLENELKGTNNTRKKNILSKEIKEILVSCITHQKQYISISTILKKKGTSWTQDLSNEKIESFLQYCLIPRITFTPSDALFSAEFLFSAFDEDTIIKIFDILVKSGILNSLLFSSTHSEANNIGIFYSHVVERFEQLRCKEEFKEKYGGILCDWDKSLTEQVVFLLMDKGYMSIRNAIEFMKHFSKVFPIIHENIEILCEILNENLVNETREDIKLPTFALLGHLKARLKIVVKVEDFRPLTEVEEEERAKYASELKEISDYENGLANKKKEEKLRSEIELRKKNREQNSLPPGPSKTSKVLPLYKVFERLDNVIYYISKNRLQSAIYYFNDANEVDKVKKIIQNKKSSIEDFRNAIFEIFNEYFSSLVQYPNMHDFVMKIKELKRAVRNLNNQQETTEGDMYSDETPNDLIRKTSRYNASSSIGNKEAVEDKKDTKQVNESLCSSAEPAHANSTSSRYNRTDNIKEKEEVEDKGRPARSPLPSGPKVGGNEPHTRFSEMVRKSSSGRDLGKLRDNNDHHYSRGKDGNSQSPRDRMNNSRNDNDYYKHNNRDNGGYNRNGPRYGNNNNNNNNRHKSDSSSSSSRMSGKSSNDYSRKQDNNSRLNDNRDNKRFRGNDGGWTTKRTDYNRQSSGRDVRDDRARYSNERNNRDHRQNSQHKPQQHQGRYNR